MGFDFITFFIGLLLLGSLSLYVGIHPKNGNKTVHEFTSGNKNLGFWSLFLTLLATQVGGGALLGTAKEAIASGPFAVCYSLGQALGFILLGMGVGSRMQALGVATTAEIFEKRYQSIWLRRIAATFSVFSLAGILMAMVVAARSFLQSIKVDNEWIVISFWLVLVIYTVHGGFQAVVKTDIIQVLFLVVILLVSFLFALGKQPALFGEIIQKYDWGVAYEKSKGKFLGWLLLPFLFVFIEQDIAQRCIAGKSSQVIKQGCLVAGIALILVSFIPIFFGMLVPVLGLEVPTGGNPLMVSVMATTHPIVAGLAACAVLAAIISTADSILIAITSNLCHDFVIKNSSQSTQWAKVATALIGLTALGASYWANNIFFILTKSYEVSVSTLLIPVAMALFDKEKRWCSWQAAWGSILTSLVSLVILGFVDLSGGFQVFIVLFLSLGGLFIGEFIARQQNKLDSKK